MNARPPAPLTMCTVFPAHEIMHMIWWALGQAVPERGIAGWGKNVFPVTAGRDADGATWVMYHWGGNSGAGAVDGRDGFNQMGPMITLGGLVIPNAETYEQLYPVTRAAPRAALRRRRRRAPIAAAPASTFEVDVAQRRRIFVPRRGHRPADRPRRRGRRRPAASARSTVAERDQAPRTPARLRAVAPRPGAR